MKTSPIDEIWGEFVALAARREFGGAARGSPLYVALTRKMWILLREAEALGDPGDPHTVVLDFNLEDFGFVG